MAEIKIPDYLPFSAVVGQPRMKQALEIAYVQPGISGVLLTGERGTAKSTVARAFAGAFSTKPMVTLPMNATEDRVVGGYNIDKLVHEGVIEEVAGLIEDADGTILYIDEVNLLDDHIVNIILDVAASGILVVEHEGHRRTSQPRFTMIGTMNPEEGELRPQLLDRFDLSVQIRVEAGTRMDVLRRMIDLDAALQERRRGNQSEFFADLEVQDATRKRILDQARQHCPSVTFADGVLEACVNLSNQLNVAGYRGERVLALAAQAQTAIDGESVTTLKHLRDLAPLALQHRIRFREAEDTVWGKRQDDIVNTVLA